MPFHIFEDEYGRRSSIPHPDDDVGWSFLRLCASWAVGGLVTAVTWNPAVGAAAGAVVSEITRNAQKSDKKEFEARKKAQEEQQ